MARHTYFLINRKMYKYFRRLKKFVLNIALHPSWYRVLGQANCCVALHARKETDTGQGYSVDRNILCSTKVLAITEVYSSYRHLVIQYIFSQK